MITDSTTILVIIGIAVAVALAVLALSGNKNILTLFTKQNPSPALQISRAATKDFPPALIDRPIVEFNDQTVITIEKELVEQPKFEIVEDEESALLKAAEIVVEKIQDIVSHIASNPPNPEEVFTKIRAILKDYRIFHNTEYFEAINSFVAVTVERDCGIQFTKAELMQLWE